MFQLLDSERINSWKI